MTFVDLESLRRRLPALRKEWHDPSAHHLVVIDGVLQAAKQEALMRSFPDSSWENWELISNSLQFGKRSCESIEVFPAALAAGVHELYSSPVIRFLEELTEIEGLLPDPHLWGGGLHCMQRGGYLWPHADFLQGRNSGLKRVINLVLYVHPTWTPDMGGNFERWKGRELVRSVSPDPGRCLIFETDAESIHAVSQISGDRLRQSIALFYYAVVKKPDVSLDHTTAWSMRLNPPYVSIRRRKLLWASLLMRSSLYLKRGARYLNQRAERVVNSD